MFSYLFFVGVMLESWTLKFIISLLFEFLETEAKVYAWRFLWLSLIFLLVPGDNDDVISDSDSSSEEFSFSSLIFTT